MPKKIEDIIVPERKRSIRDIPIPENRRKNGEQPPSSFIMKEYNSSAVPRDSIHISQEEVKPPSIKKTRKGFWWGIGVSLLVLIFILLSIFNGATLSYVPKSSALSLKNESFIAQKTGNDTLSYSVAKLSKDKGVEVLASGEEEVSRKASGTIVVYNSSTKSQRFRATTRFETPEGKIYQVEDAIVVPAKKVVNGSEQPGSLEVTVYAENPGKEYNIGLTDFTLPGLEGTSLFTAVYARSKTEMSRGFVGKEKIVSEQDRLRVKNELETSLRAELISDAIAQVPKDLILFPSLSFIIFEDLPQTDPATPGRVVANRRANLYGVMFKRSDLSTYLSLGKITLAPGESVDILEPELLTLSFSDDSSLDILNADEIHLSVTGDTMVVWRTDEVSLKTDIVGKPKKYISSILNNYPTVISATATIRPFWKKSFPSDGSRITIKQLPVK